MSHREKKQTTAKKSDNAETIKSGKDASSKRKQNGFLICAGGLFLILLTGCLLLRLSGRPDAGKENLPYESGEQMDPVSPDVSVPAAVIPSGKGDETSGGQGTQIVPPADPFGDLSEGTGKEESGVQVKVVPFGPKEESDGDKTIDVSEVSSSVTGKDGNTDEKTVFGPAAEVSEGNTGTDANRGKHETGVWEGSEDNPFGETGTDVKEAKGETAYGKEKPGEGKHF